MRFTSPGNTALFPRCQVTVFSEGQRHLVRKKLYLSFSDWMSSDLCLGHRGSGDREGPGYEAAGPATREVVPTEEERGTRGASVGAGGGSREQEVPTSQGFWYIFGRTGAEEAPMMTA